MRVRSLGLEKPLEEGMTTHSSILAWGIPWMEEPGGLRFIGSQRVRRDQSDLAPVPWLQVLSGFSCPLSGPESSPPCLTASIPLLPTPGVTFLPHWPQPHLLAPAGSPWPWSPALRNVTSPLSPSSPDIPLCLLHLLLFPSSVSLPAPTSLLILSLMGPLDDMNCKWKAQIQRISCINDTVFFIYYDCHAISCL